MVSTDVHVHICSILEFLVTSRAIISSLKAEMHILHVSPQLRRELLSTNQANGATITGSDVVLQHLIHSEGMASIHSYPSSIIF